MPVRLSVKAWAMACSTKAAQYSAVFLVEPAPIIVSTQTSCHCKWKWTIPGSIFIMLHSFLHDSYSTTVCPLLGSCFMLHLSSLWPDSSSWFGSQFLPVRCVVHCRLAAKVHPVLWIHSFHSTDWNVGLKKKKSIFLSDQHIFKLNSWFNFCLIGSVSLSLSQSTVKRLDWLKGR